MTYVFERIDGEGLKRYATIDIAASDYAGVRSIRCAWLAGV